MAIKGKSRSRSARAVTPGPKPVYQPVKRRLLARRGFWFAVGGVLSAALLAALAVGFVVERNQAEQEELVERMRVAVGQFRGEVEGVLATVGQPQAPASFLAFADLSAVVGELEAETKQEGVSRSRLTTVADDTTATSTAALEAFRAIEETELVGGQGFSEEFVLYVINSKENFVRSMLLYREVAGVLRLAADAEGVQRDQLAERARGILSVASEVFARGYTDYVEAQARAGVFQPTSGAALPPAPTGS